jgi:ATP-dependent helicase YprA (DUF1998 family)
MCYAKEILDHFFHSSSMEFRLEETEEDKKSFLDRHTAPVSTAISLFSSAQIIDFWRTSPYNRPTNKGLILLPRRRLYVTGKIQH